VRRAERSVASGFAPEPAVGRSLRAWMALLLRGMAMGIAELVPGVSGGTIAFVTGIYDELVRTLARFRLESLQLLWRDGLRAFWQSHNLTFLLVLGIGMVAAVLAFARLIQYLLDHVPVLVWAFFFGLIAASVVQIGRHRRVRTLLGFGLLGVVLALLVLQAGVREVEAPLWMYFVGGMVAVSAWLLPGVSGSFLLLAMGLYEPVLRAINAGEWVIPLVLLVGCGVGILSFARLLGWLMIRVREPMLAGLTGFMAGALPRLWPWQHEGRLMTPQGYEVASGDPSLPVAAVAMLIVGALVLWSISRLE
jgi:putative membrane protein